MTDAEKEIALKMAIEGLDEEPCDDFISRKFMLKRGATCIAKRDGSGNLMALGAIKDLPASTIIRSKGHWAKNKSGEILFFTCSECSYSAKVIYKYCPNCGAKMECRGRR